MFDMQALADTVADLQAELPRLTTEADDPNGEGLARLLWQVRQARTALYDIEGTLEVLTGRAMFEDQLLLDDVRVERYRPRDRKQWDHDSWRHDVRDKIARARGLLNCTVISRDGEVVGDTGLILQALTDAQDVEGAHAPKTTSLRTLGLNADDYCSSTPAPAKVRIVPNGGEVR